MNYVVMRDTEEMARYKEVLKDILNKTEYTDRRKEAIFACILDDRAVISHLSIDAGCTPARLGKSIQSVLKDVNVYYREWYPDTDSLFALGVSARVCRLLKHKGVRSLSQLMPFTPRQLKYMGLHENTISLIRMRLPEYYRSGILVNEDECRKQEELWEHEESLYRSVMIKVLKSKHHSEWEIRALTKYFITREMKLKHVAVLFKCTHQNISEYMKRINKQVRDKCYHEYRDVDNVCMLGLSRKMFDRVRSLGIVRISDLLYRDQKELRQIGFSEEEIFELRDAYSYLMFGI